MKTTCLVLLVLFAVSYAANSLADGIDFAASAPLCYDHQVGGGAYNDGTNGRDKDAVESLEGADYACGDLVTFFFRLRMASSGFTKTSMQVHVQFLGDTTGQSGVAFGYVVDYWLSNSSVVNGDGNAYGVTGGINSCNPKNILANYKRDSGVKSNGNEVLSLISQKVENAALFNAKSTLEVNFLITNLEPGEVVLPVVNVRLLCSGAKATGNLQGSLTDAWWGTRILADGNLEDLGSPSGGVQTIPLKSVGNVAPCAAETAPLKGIDFSADLTITGSGANSYLQNGASITGKFYYCWSTGQYSYTTGSGPNLRTRIRTYNPTCSLGHLSDNDYTYSSCGCELVQQFPTSAQPQLFWDARGGYYDPSKTVVEGSVTHYYAWANASLTTGVTELWTSNTAPNFPTKIKWADGTIFTFTNPIAITCSSSAIQQQFTAAASCTTSKCGRPIDVMLVVELSSENTLAEQQASRTLAKNLVNYFNFGSTAVQMGLITFNDKPKLVLSPDPNPQNVINAINSANGIACPPNNECSGNSYPGPAITLAAQTLTNPGRPSPDIATKVIVLILKGYTDTSAAGIAAIKSAVDNAYNSYNTFVLGVPYTTLNVQSELFNLVTNQDPRNLLQRYYLTGSGVVGGVGMDSPPGDIAARVCGLAPVSTSCSSTTCCGLCDTSCAGSATGACITGTSGGTFTCNASLSNCETTTSLNQQTGCCVTAPSVGCPTGLDSQCRASTCDPVTKQCVLSAGCPAPQPCWTVTCTSGKCVQAQKPKPAFGSCDSIACVNNEWIVTSGGNAAACTSSDSCITQSCQVVNGLNTCVSTPSNDPGANLDNACVDRICVSPTGWQSVNVSCGTAPCTVTTCDPVLGCQNTVTNCIKDPTNLCEITTCNAGTGACPTEPVYKQCTLPADTCDTVASCNPKTGLCETSTPRICPDPDFCGVVCVKGVCTPTPACTPTPPTPTPTPPTPTPVVTPTPTPGVTPTPTPVITPTPVPPPTPVPSPCPASCKKTACYNRECLPTGLCGVPTARDCSYLLPTTNHYCTSVGCSESRDPAGCYLIEVTSAECEEKTPHGPCETVVADDDFPGCCKVIPKTCQSTKGPCYTSSCNATTGVCEDTYACTLPTDNKCQVSTCTATGCVVSQKCQAGVVGSSDCLSRSCNASTGECGEVFSGCNDEIPCTIDSCSNSTGTYLCTYEPVCGAVDPDAPIDLCVTKSCVVDAEGQSSCVSGVPDCPVSRGCIQAGCDALTGCFEKQVDSLCQTDACSTAVCLSDGNCSITPKNCTDELLANLTFCTEAYCDANAGGECRLKNVDCADRGVVASNGSCEIVKCQDGPEDEPLNGECKKEGGDCYNLIAIVTGITAGAIAGIVVAAVVAGLLVSGGAAAGATLIKPEEDTVVYNNPLHEGDGRSGINQTRS